jgi:Lipopolysaccharide kinase (Kdo/WaaP) family
MKLQPTIREAPADIVGPPEQVPTTEVHFMWPESYVRCGDHSHTTDALPPCDELLVRPDVMSAFTRRGWTTTAAILMDSGLQVLRQVNGRDNCRTTWVDPTTGRTRTAYVKRHAHALHPSAGWDEATAAGLCLSAGVPCVDVLAAGRTFDEKGNCRGSVLITAAVCDELSSVESDSGQASNASRSLYLIFQLQNLCGGPTPKETVQRRVWLQQLASTVKRLHAAQLYHGDLYLQHAFPKSDSEGRTQVALIDLQLLKQFSGVLGWYRWIKDLWQMRFSLDRLNCDADTVRHWYECYFATGDTPQPLRWWQRVFVGLVRISSPRRLLRLWRLRQSGKQEEYERSLLPFYRGDAGPPPNERHVA